MRRTDPVRAVDCYPSVGSANDADRDARAHIGELDRGRPSPMIRSRTSSRPAVSLGVDVYPGATASGDTHSCFSRSATHLAGHRSGTESRSWTGELVFPDEPPVDIDPTVEPEDEGPPAWDSPSAHRESAF